MQLTCKQLCLLGAYGECEEFYNQCIKSLDVRGESGSFLQAIMNYMSAMSMQGSTWLKQLQDKPEMGIQIVNISIHHGAHDSEEYQITLPT